MHICCIDETTIDIFNESAAAQSLPACPIAMTDAKRTPDALRLAPILVYACETFELPVCFAIHVSVTWSFCNGLNIVSKLKSWLVDLSDQGYHDILVDRCLCIDLQSSS